MKRGLCLGLIFVLSLFVVSGVCNDSDGKNYFIKGTCTDSEGIHVDKCGGSVSADDWYCTASGNCALQGISCTYFYGSGYVCEDGACVYESSGGVINETSECIDSDGDEIGYDRYLVKGICTSGGQPM